MVAAESLNARDLSKRLSVTPRAVNKRASAESWAYDERPGRGGRKRFYLIDQLPADVQAAVLAPYRDSAPEPRPVRAEAVLLQSSDAERSVAAERAALLDELDEFLAAHAGELAGRTKATKLWAEDRALSPATLYRWRKARKAAGTAGLCRRYARMGRQASWSDEAKRHLRALWLHQNKPSQQWAIDRLRFKAIEHEWSLPGDRTLRRYLDSIPAPVRILLREGETAFRTQCLPYLERDYDALQPNEIWNSDHCRLDVFVRDAEGRVFRPWLTGWQDIASRRLVSSMLAYQCSSDTIAATFVQAARKHGLPGVSYQDNGRDYSSKRLAGGYDRFRQTKFAKTKTDEEMHGLYKLLDIEAVFARPAHGQAKAIERFFHSSKEQFEKSLPDGYIGGSPAERPEDADAAIKAGKVHDFLEIQQLWAEWVEKVYHRKPHSGRGMADRTPNKVWNDWLAQGGQPRMVGAATLALLLQQSREVKLGRQGLTVSRRHFWSAELLELAELGDTLVARYDESDLSQVWVFTRSGQYLCEAPVVERTAYRDKDAPAAGRQREKAVEQLTTALVQEVREDRKGMDVRELVLGVVTDDEECETSDVVQPVRTALDAPARKIAKRSGATKAERKAAQRKRKKDREQAERILMSTPLDEEPETEKTDAWALMARVADLGGLD